MKKFQATSTYLALAFRPAQLNLHQIVQKTLASLNYTCNIRSYRSVAEKKFISCLPQ